MLLSMNRIFILISIVLISFSVFNANACGKYKVMDMPLRSGVTVGESATYLQNAYILGELMDNNLDNVREYFTSYPGRVNMQILSGTRGYAVYRARSLEMIDLLVSLGADLNIDGVNARELLSLEAEIKRLENLTDFLGSGGSGGSGEF